MNKLLHIDLFSGIGGASLAVDAVWKNVEHIFVENDKFCQNVIRKHWPHSEIYGDIRTFTNTAGKRLREREPQDNRPRKDGETHRLTEKDEIGTDETGVYILTGGFPCQPFSQAGRRKGTDDNRHLWPQMFRVIREFKPEWVIGENVAGLLTIQQGVVFEQVCLDLEAEGYEVQPFVIPAVAVNAPHRRDRVWIVAHRAEQGLEGCGGKRERFASDVKNPDIKRRNRRSENGGQILERRSPEIEDARPSWEANWLEVATRLCGVDDGLSSRLVILPDGRKISGSKWRQEALKGYGNAWVPQVAIEIMKAIKEIT